MSMCQECQKQYPDFKISINLSYIQIIKSAILTEITSSIANATLRPSSIIMELTESGHHNGLEIQFETVKIVCDSLMQSTEQHALAEKTAVILGAEQVDLVFAAELSLPKSKMGNFGNICIIKICNINACDNAARDGKHFPRGLSCGSASTISAISTRNSAPNTAISSSASWRSALSIPCCPDSRPTGKCFSKTLDLVAERGFSKQAADIVCDLLNADLVDAADHKFRNGIRILYHNAPAVDPDRGAILPEPAVAQVVRLLFAACQVGEIVAEHLIILAVHKYCIFTLRSGIFCCIFSRNL